jgi:hypothetical protein
MNSKTVRTVMTAFLLLLAPTAARSDVVPSPPAGCPPGSVGTTSHSGPYCRPATCERGCSVGSSCKAQSLCIAPKELHNRRGTKTSVDEVVGDCSAGAPCSAGTCKTMQVCVSDERITGAKRFGCRCSTVASHRSNAGFIGVALAACLIRRRRSTRASS